MNFKFSDTDIIKAIGTLPSADLLKEASAEDLRVLLCLMAQGCDTTEKQLSRASFCSEPRVRSALTYWQGCGVLVKTDEPQEKRKKPLASARELDVRDAEQVAKYIKENNMQSLLDECQHISGRIYNTSEASVIVGLSEQLGLEDTYILTLLAWCEKRGKKTLRYVEKTAFGLFDDGVDTPGALDAYIKRRETAQSAEGKLRRLFGISDRTLSRTEQECFTRWVCDFGYDMDIIGLAYDITVDTKQKASVRYTDAILTRWYSAGVHTEAQAHSLTERERAARPAVQRGRKQPTPPAVKEGEGAGSFSTDDFFNAALLRSYGTDSKETKK